MRLKWNVISLCLFICICFGGSQLAAQPLSLKDCIRIAMENNINIETNRNLAEMASNDYLASYSRILPAINTSFSASKTTLGPSESISRVPVTDSTGNVTYQVITTLSGKQTFDSHRFNLSVNQNIFDGGRWWNGIRRSKADKNAAYFNQDAQIAQTVTAVAQNYINLLKQEKLLEVNQLAVQRSQDNLDRSEKMFEIGSVAKIDVFRARVNLGQDKITFINQRNFVEQARRTMNISLGRDPNTPLEIAQNINFNYNLSSMEELMNLAFQNHPELKRQQMAIRSNE